MVINLTTFGMVCRDNKDPIIVSLDKKIGDVSVLIAKGIVIREALKITRDHYMDKIVIEVICNS